MGRFLFHGRCALGLAAIPALILGAMGYPDSTTIPVLFSAWACGWVQGAWPDEPATHQQTEDRK